MNVAVKTSFLIGSIINNLGKGISLTVIAPGSLKGAKKTTSNGTSFIGKALPLTLETALKTSTVEVTTSLLKDEYTLSLWISEGDTHTNINYEFYPVGGTPTTSNLMSFPKGQYVGPTAVSLQFEKSSSGGILIVGTMDIAP